MIILRWSRFPESDVASYRVYRSMIGFKAPLADLTGKDLVLKLNGGLPQHFEFTGPIIVEAINSVILGGKASYCANGTHFILRSNLRQAPGSIEIVSGSALSVLGLNVGLITERSDAELIGEMVANTFPTTLEEFSDPDGSLQDFYAVSSVNQASVESLKTPWQQPITTTGPLCVIEGVISDLQGVRIPDAEIIATIQAPPERLRMTYITKEPVCTQSSPDGRFSLPLLQGALVKLEIPQIGFSRMVTIPCQSYVLIQDILVDEDYIYKPGR